jgi:hypothetical protein
MSVPTLEGVRCGNRAQHGEQVVYHASVAAVKDCYAESGRFEGQPATEPQVVWCYDCGTAHPQGLHRGVSVGPTPEQVAEAAEKARMEAARARYAAWRTIPVFSRDRGYYALQVGDNPVMFYRVERPSKGKHAGKTFVRVQASDTFHSLPWVGQAAVLDEIAKDPEAAGLLYAREINKCSRCNRSLTDEDSRARGMGKDCFEKWGG